MSNIIWIISVILILVILSLFFKELYSERKQKIDITTNIIRPKKICFFVGVVGAVVLLGILVIGWFLDTSSSFAEKIICSILTIVFITLLYGYLIFFYLNYKITVYDDYFVYQNFWLVKKKIYYKDIVINNEKLYPQIRLKKDNGKTRLVFKLAGILENEEIFMEAYKNWKNNQKNKNSKV